MIKQVSLPQIVPALPFISMESKRTPKEWALHGKVLISTKMLITSILRLTFPKMIHCNTDEAVMNGVLNNSFIGILGTGRLEEKIKNGQITILDTYASHVPVKLFTLASNLENPLMNKFFNSFQNSFPVCDFING